MPAKPPSWELYQRGLEQFRKGDFQGAIYWLVQAEARAQETGESYSEMSAIHDQSLAYGNMGDYRKALEAASRLVEVARRYQVERYIMIGVFHVADCLAPIDAIGRWREIKTNWLEGLELARKLSDSFYETYHLLRLGQYSVKVGDWEEGRSWLQQTLDTLHHYWGDACYRFEVYKSLTELARKEGNFEEAVRCAEIAVGSAEDDGNLMFIADAKVSLAGAKYLNGQTGEARQILAELMPDTKRGDWKYVEVEAQYWLSEMSRAEGRLEEAQAAAQQMVEVARRMQVKEEEVRGLLSLGQAQFEANNKEEAKETLRQARRLSQERNYADHYQKVETLLAGLS